MNFVSVILPAYNAAPYLAECIESILGQTWSDFELIIIDDGSTDETPRIAADFARKDDRIRIITQQNKGIGESRNIGVQAAQSDWLTFVDADDVIHPAMIEIMMECARRTDAAIVSVGIKKYYNDRQLDAYRASAARQLSMAGDAKKFYYRSDAEIVVRKMLYQTGFINNSPYAKLFRTSLFKDIKFPPTLYEDLAAIPEVFLAYARTWSNPLTIHIPLALYYYRQREDSQIHKMTPNRLVVLDITEQWIEKASNDPKLSKAAADRHLSAAFNMLMLTGGRPEPEYKAAFERSWKIIKELRFSSLMNPRVRLKNKLGILASLLGPRPFRR